MRIELCILLCYQKILSRILQAQATTNDFHHLTMVMILYSALGFWENPFETITLLNNIPADKRKFLEGAAFDETSSMKLLNLHTSMNPSIQTCMHASIHPIMQSRLNNTGQKITHSPTYNHDQWDDRRRLQNHMTMELTVVSFLVIAFPHWLGKHLLTKFALVSFSWPQFPYIS